MQYKLYFKSKIMFMADMEFESDEEAQDFILNQNRINDEYVNTTNSSISDWSLSGIECINDDGDYIFKSIEEFVS